MPRSFMTWLRVQERTIGLGDKRIHVFLLSVIEVPNTAFRFIYRMCFHDGTKVMHKR